MHKRPHAQHDSRADDYAIDTSRDRAWPAGLAAVADSSNRVRKRHAMQAEPMHIEGAVAINPVLLALIVTMCPVGDTLVAA
jgi:hypothetical protein